MGTQAPTIQETTDYSKFKLMTGNRTVELAHVQRLMGEMRYNSELLQAAPILVNENYFIVDGQHRFAAAEQLGLPIYYIVRAGLTISAARHMNVTQKRWTLMDFARSFSASGNNNYADFIRLANRFSTIAPNIIMKYAEMGHGRGTSKDFRNGNFLIKDIEDVIDHLEKLSIIAEKTNQLIAAPMAMSLLAMFIDEEAGGEFNFIKFIGKIDGHPGALNVFVQANTIRGNLRSIEDVFNFMSNTRLRLY